MGLFQEERRTTLLRKNVKRVVVAARTRAAPMTTRPRLTTATLMVVLTREQVHARIAALMTGRRRLLLNKTATAIPLVPGGRPLPRPANMEMAALIKVATREISRKVALMTSPPRLLKKKAAATTPLVSGSHHLPRHLHPRPAKLAITMLVILYLMIVFFLEIIVHALAVVVIDLLSKKAI